MRIVNNSSLELPSYQTEGSAGFDLRANIKDKLEIAPLERLLVPTGLRVEIPSGFVGYVCSRSGLALKKGIQVINAPGVVDCDYRGDVGVILVNLSRDVQVIEPGERIAQMIIAPYERVDFEIADSLDETERGSGGFGSTGSR